MLPMATFIFCWELGGGLGHAARIKPLAQALLARGHDCRLMLRDLAGSAELLSDLPVPKLQSPVWQHQTKGLLQPQVSLAEILLGNSYLQAKHLSAQIDGWLDAFKLCGAQAVIGDYAPSAVLAARIAGLPCATMGIGFYMPPAVQPMPAFRDWEPIPPARIAHAEAQVLANVNSVLAAHGRAPMQALWQLYSGDRPLLCTWPEFDHYSRQKPLGNSADQVWWGPTFLPSTGQPAAANPSWPAGSGPRVFAYLKEGHPDHAAWLKALVDKGCRVICYMPEVAAGKPLPLRSAAIHYAMRPADLGTLMPDCDLLVCHAGEATLTQGLLAGVPLLLLPMQPEQFLMARGVGRTGAGINAAECPRPTPMAALLVKLLDEPQMREQARAFATRYRDFSHTEQTRRLADQFEALLLV
ncbi:hypothetical protein BH11PSE10_BH11PSE10_00550 [soil metagenome]